MPCMIYLPIPSRRQPTENRLSLPKQQKAPERRQSHTSLKTADQPQRQAADAAPEVKKESPPDSHARETQGSAKGEPLVKPVVPAPAAEPSTVGAGICWSRLGVEVSIITDEKATCANMEGDTQGI